MTEFVALRHKTYSYLNGNGDQEMCNKKKP